MVDSVVFDIGGVLADDVWEHLLLDDDGVIKMYSRLHKTDLKRVGKLLWDVFAYLPETDQRSWAELERLYWRLFIECFRKELPQTASPDIFIQMTDSFIQPVNGMSQLLEQLKSRSVNLAICSNNNEFWSKRQMDNLRLHRFFEPAKVILSCRIGVSKSSTGFEMFHAAAAALRVAPSHCVFIDDRMDNVKRAQSCGMIGLHFTDSAALSEDLGRLGLL